MSSKKEGKAIVNRRHTLSYRLPKQGNLGLGLINLFYYYKVAISALSGVTFSRQTIVVPFYHRIVVISPNETR